MKIVSVVTFARISKKGRRWRLKSIKKYYKSQFIWLYLCFIPFQQRTQSWEDNYRTSWRRFGYIELTHRRLSRKAIFYPGLLIRYKSIQDLKLNGFQKILPAISSPRMTVPLEIEQYHFLSINIFFFNR